MAADSAVNQAANATMGAAQKVLSFAWNRVTPFKLSGIYTTVGLGALAVGAVWAAAPAAMAAATAPSIIPAAAASTQSFGAGLLFYAKAALGQVSAAASVAFKGIGTIVTSANPEVMKAGFDTFMAGMHGSEVAMVPAGAGAGAGAAAVPAAQSPFLNMLGYTH